jgi:hypothetical protein
LPGQAVQVPVDLIGQLDTWKKALRCRAMQTSINRSAFQ